ncbi:MAG: chorismate-binding protein [Tepidimonas sp.]|nr:chorismate-binding protein [Tepidimonas sp.]
MCHSRALVDFTDPLQPQGSRWRWWFESPVCHWVAHQPDEVPALLDEVHAASHRGLWCVGWVAYEAAQAWWPALGLRSLPAGQAYAVWLGFRTAQTWSTQVQPCQPGAAGWHLGPWQRPWWPSQARAAIRDIRRRIERGECYQVNLTEQRQARWVPTHAKHGCCALQAWFDVLRDGQPAGYAMLLQTPDLGIQPWAVLSLSPELFFDWHADRIMVQPMKGTAPRHCDPLLDQAAAQRLREDSKERAENVMIVDLMRNDLGRVACTGSVRVTELLTLHALPTVWQMTSTVQARTRPGLRLSELMGALFPCGSVTGAPKKQAMHIIDQLEPQARGVYCGAMGVMQPGGRVTLNVPIRTLAFLGHPENGYVRYGVGSGVTWGSQPASELREWEAKMRVVHRGAMPFELLESLRLEHGRPWRWRAHWRRTLAAACAFGWPWGQNPHPVRRRWLEAVARLARQYRCGVYKLRVRVDRAAEVHVEAAPLVPWPHPARVALAPRPMVADDPMFLRHKTTRRQHYDAFRIPAGCVDVLLYNEHGQITEGTLGNVAAQIDGQWVTPPVQSGLLPGVMRAHYLQQQRLQERVLTLDDLPRVQTWAWLNSVRGWTEVELVRYSDSA